MKIKKGQQIIVTFSAKTIDDIDSFELIDWLMDEAPENLRVFNPGYREITEDTK